MSTYLRRSRYTPDVTWDDLQECNDVESAFDNNDTVWYDATTEDDWLKSLDCNTQFKKKEENAIFIDVPGDGSCFYHCIAKALQDCRAYFDEGLERLINNYIVAHLYSMDQIDIDDISEEIGKLVNIEADLIRYICAINIDDDDLETHNMILLADDKKTLKTKKELVDLVMNSNDFADFVQFRTLITKGFKNIIGIFILDDTVDNNIVSFPEEWTVNKKYNIILKREALHYNLVQLKKNNTRQNIIVDSKTAYDFIENYNT